MKPQNNADRESRDRALFNQIAPQYARKDILPSTRRARQAIVRHACAPVAKRAGGSLGVVVDIGCGVGAQAFYLRGMYDRYIGIDYADDLVAIGGELLSDIPEADLICANVHDAIELDVLADTVLAVGALHHMPDVVGAFDGLRALARPGANFIAIEPQNGNPVIQAMRKFRGRVDSSYSNEQVFFDLDQLAGLLEQANMVDCVLEYQNFLTPPFAQVAVSPEFIWNGLSRLAVGSEPLIDFIMRGPLRRLSWNVVVHARFGPPGKTGKIN